MQSLNNLLKSMALSVEASSAAPSYLRKGIMRRMNIQIDPPEENASSSSASCISVDFDATVPERLAPNSAGTRSLLSLAEKYEIPITWAMCGKTADEDPDSLRAIKGAGIQHELAVHTYSHLDVSSADPAEVSLDIRKCIDALSLGREPTTFVFPWNREGRFDVLRGMGFVTFRGKARRIGRPAQKEGMWNVSPVWYAGELAYGASGFLTKLLDVCIANNSVFHLWTHPWDVVKPTPDQYSSRTLEPLFKAMAERRSEGRLQTLTLESTSNRFGGSTPLGATTIQPNVEPTKA